MVINPEIFYIPDMDDSISYIEESEEDMIKYSKILVGDFETTVYEGQTDTEVWASALVELNTEDVIIFSSIDDTFDYLNSLKKNILVYYHNLKFDGSFWINFLLNKNYSQAYTVDEKDINTLRFVDESDMKKKSFKYLISDMGAWYKIVIRTDTNYIEIRDSLKLLPFSVKRIGDSFKTKHRKLEIEYEGYRHAGGYISPEEKEYIGNDVLVVKEALEFMYQENHNKLTIGSCCLSEYKQKHYGEYEMFHPDIYTIELEGKYGSPNAGEYVRKSYRGGWCYLVPNKSSKILTNGCTADVNSLYPSMMSSESGNKYPYGNPIFWSGNYIPTIALDSRSYFYFVRFRCRFYLKKGMLPFVQIKGNKYYPRNENLITSDYYNKQTKTYHRYIKDKEGNINDTCVTLTMTQTDFNLFKKHYNVADFEILDGCYFNATDGLFDMYMNKYKKIKMESKGAVRELAKLFLNNLYGKMASSKRSSFKVAVMREDKSLGFFNVDSYEKEAGYIPIGSAITSYARAFTINAAQANYYGDDKRGFVYADTDSIHCDLEPSEVKGIVTHPTNFCCWKLESQWDVGYFVRAKTYIEHITHEDEQPIDKPYYNVKCAGMPDKSKNLFIKSLTGEAITDQENYNEEELNFLSVKRTLDDFNIGLTIPGKLVPHQIKGGVILCDTTYQMRPNSFGL